MAVIQRTVKVGNIAFSNDAPLALIAGPCVIESRAHAEDMAGRIRDVANSVQIGFIFKSSYDKANRTANTSFRGLGMDEGLDILSTIRDKFKVPVLTDVHTAEQCAVVAQHVDVLQIPAFLCRQTDLLVAAANTGKVVNVKKGQFLAPWDMKNVANKLADTGNHNIMLCERGASFGYNTLVSDMRALPIMAETGYPVIFDATHSVQQPGGQGTTTGGDRRMVPVLARAAVAVGVAGVFMEVHDNPDKAPSDGPNMLNLKDLRGVLETLLELDHITKRKNKELAA
jgi:2-dehydro-3-deoxyphosphooctonate aldolase (KDO 8-P synthase)